MTLPGSTTARSEAGGRVVEVTLSGTAVLAAGGSEATHLTVLVDGVHNPVDAGVTANDLVRGVDHNHLKVLVGSVLAHPVRVEHAEATALASSALLGQRPQAALPLELSDTLVGGLTVGNTLGDRALAASALDTHAVDAVALLGLVAKTARLVWACRASCAVNGSQLAKLPAADAQKKAQSIALLLLVKLLEVLVGAHGGGSVCVLE